MSVVTETRVDATGLIARAIEAGRNGMLGHRGGPFGAVVVAADGTVVAEGCNQVTSCNDPTAHAEVVAIRAACAVLATFCLTGYSLYTSCEPCPMCLSAAYWARLDEIVYAASREDAAAGGFDDALIYEELGRPVDSRRIPMRRLSPEAGAALFAEWRELEGRTPY
jgi:guanine deaminase